MSDDVVHGVSEGEAVAPWKIQAGDTEFVFGHGVDGTPMSWLWPGFLPNCATTMIAGQVANGKTAVFCKLTAHVTTGEPWPDGTECKRGRVMFFSQEDDFGKILVPRIKAAGGDVSRVASSEGIQSIPDQIANLEMAVAGLPDLRLLIFDPLLAYLGNIRGYYHTDLRKILGRLQKLAVEREFAIIFAGHFKKHVRGDLSPIVQRVLGGSAIYQFARMAHIAGPYLMDRERRSLRCLMPMKANFLRMPAPGISYEIASVDGQPVVQWADDVDDVTDEQVYEWSLLIAKKTPIQNAEEYLLKLFAPGLALPATEVLAGAALAGIAEKTVRKAIKELGFTQGWVARVSHWYPPTGEVEKVA